MGFLRPPLSCYRAHSARTPPQLIVDDAIERSLLEQRNLPSLREQVVVRMNTRCLRATFVRGRATRSSAESSWAMPATGRRQPEHNIESCAAHAQLAVACDNT
jgi:hypothetical protein